MIISTHDQPDVVSSLTLLVWDYFVTLPDEVGVVSFSVSLGANY